KGANLVLMGKTMAGNDEGQNIIEPALMGKPVVSGPKLKNIRQALDVLVKADAVRRIANDEDLPGALTELLADPASAEAMGQRAEAVIRANRGALKTSVNALEDLMK
ncbi:MAG: 3-deoxy-D-manno-octulosonic acid transferase, partial [Lentisphaeria bacterium]|nr:3-deoxy-D-manno-octulosonic acid transferase [Lentisphaeria bacterium]